MSTKKQWQEELIDVIDTVEDLAKYCHLDSIQLNKIFFEHKKFPLKVPKFFAGQIEKGNYQDPILKQIMVNSLENKSSINFILDPVGDNTAIKEKGIIHKYKNRLLIPVTGTCAIHCRYCFRQNFPYAENRFAKTELDNYSNYIIQNPAINEIILSGGDPLSLNDDSLNLIIQTLEQIEQIKTIRIHTRFPVVIPSRIDDDFMAILPKIKNTVVCFHINHAREISPEFKLICKKLRTANVHLLNQSVLLKGVNDSVEALKDLSLALFECGILPYYLNQLDRVFGAEHFEVNLETGKKLVLELRNELQGYLIPRYIQEIPGELAKTILL
jgi:EF-P beta-lysylation protein EpmB